MRSSTAERLSHENYRCMKQYSHSQWREDIRLLPLLLCAAGASLHKPGRGSFLELGANNGVNHSNTYMLERCFGWGGLLIEGNPSNYAELAASERNATKLHSAVCNVKGTMDFSQEGGELAAAGNSAKRHQLGAMAPVPCDTLAALLGGGGYPRGVDFFSLDVEGAEAAVLATADPALFKVVIMEVGKCCPPGVHGSACQCNATTPASLRLERAGLVRYPRLEAQANHINHVFVRPDVATKCDAASIHTLS